MNDCANCPKAKVGVESPWVAPRRDVPLSGLLNVDKPAGMTSHDVVDSVRRFSGQRRVGHTGTLDPMATGVLPICLGQATRVAEYVMAGSKRYRAAIQLGSTTDSYDAEGTFTSANRIIDQEVAPTAESIRTAASQLGTAVSDVAADLPEVTAELRATLARAGDVVERLDAVVAASAPGVQDFAQTGLPEFVRFTQEARSLVASLERIAARLERDPARFLLGNQPPDFRR